ncbi:hypothetical protein BJ912DRAFT_1045861 [Pholiota molesta]|nr:hypothetical protein BJ912DRAFT_1045861 [Pholiota molesta]
MTPPADLPKAATAINSQGRTRLAKEIIVVGVHDTSGACDQAPCHACPYHALRREVADGVGNLPLNTERSFMGGEGQEQPLEIAERRIDNVPPQASGPSVHCKREWGDVSAPDARRPPILRSVASCTIRRARNGRAHPIRTSSIVTIQHKIPWSVDELELRRDDIHHRKVPASGLPSPWVPRRQKALRRECRQITYGNEQRNERKAMVRRKANRMSCRGRRHAGSAHPDYYPRLSPRPDYLLHAPVIAHLYTRCTTKENVEDRTEHTTLPSIAK